MAAFIIGDVHGCYNTLLALLNKAGYQETIDQLYFVGDLVGKGPHSTAVVNFVVNQANSHYVLGNHDLWCMTLAYGCYPNVDSAYTEIFANDFSLLEKWRLQSKLFLHNDLLNFAIVHAGILPQWSIEQSLLLAEQVEKVLKSPEYKDLLSHLKGDQPLCWSNSLEGAECYRFIVNAMTRMRFCDDNGCLDFREKQSKQSQYDHLKPWFAWPMHLNGCRLFYGHWAAMEGNNFVKNVFATDTGCVYEQQLTAYKVTDAFTPPQQFQIDYCD